jgi:glycosyltransferase involved in cell wall biosynthesis
MKDLKVLFVADTSSDDDCSYVRRLLVLKEGLDKFGVYTDILYLGNYFLSTPKLLMPLNIPHFLKIVKNYEIVHAAGLSTYVVGIAKPLGNFKIICDVHSSSEESWLLRKNVFDLAGNYHVLVTTITEPIARKQSDYFITASEPLRQKLVEEGIDKHRTEVIYNGVNVELFKPNEERIENDAFTVTYAGAYQKWQGIETLVEAAHLLKDAQIKFKMMGFKKADSSLKDEIKRKLKNKVELIDFLPRRGPNQPQSFVDQLCKSDILIIPRYWNPRIPKYCNPEYVRSTFGWLSTKFAEYIATGRPVIVTRLDVSAEFVERYDCGFVCDPAPESIARTILEAKDTPPEELHKKGMNGRRLAETEFDLRVISKRYFDFLSKIV